MFEIFQIDRSSVQQIKTLTAEGAKIIKNNSYLGSDLLKTTPMPQILFTDLKDSKRLGYYDSTQNLIVLSAALQEEGCETSLHNVYLHELAHYCDYVINGQSAHDTTFRQICRALDVKEEYSSAKVKETAQNRQKIKSRIEKLLNLSASDFEGEATLAMNKARILMEKYGVGENTRDMLYGVYADTMKQHTTWKGTLARGIAQTTGAFSLYEKTSKGVVHMTFYGTLEQVEVSLYMYDSLTGTINAKCEEAVRKIKTENRHPHLFSLFTKPVRISRNQICQGLVDGFCKANTREQSKTLMLCQKNNENKYRRITGYRIAHSSVRYSQSSQYAMGVSGGKTISMPSGTRMRKRITDKHTAVQRHHYEA